MSREPLDLGKVASGYELGAMLGRGGEGEVRAAVQRAFGRTVAIKRVRGDHLDARRLRRFHAEAVVTGLLEHPHIIPIYDFRVGEGGEWQLVMKQVVGTTWRDLMRPRTPAQIARSSQMGRDDHLDILLKVTDAIAFAHARGFLHRDLKPENVMVGEHGEVLVLDWGCAVSLVEPPPHPAIALRNASDGVSGTPAFMAPEQARNESARFGPATDVYLLGGMLYFYLTGRPPHRGTTVREAMQAAARGAVLPPGERTRRSVDEELAAIAMAALAADPAVRTASAAAFATALRDYRHHAEALQLVREARRRMKALDPEALDADEVYRRTMSACEQALALWPEHRGAHTLLQRTAIAHAEQAMRHGAHRVARNMATTALQQAEWLGDAAAATQAQQLGRRAVQAEAHSRSRDRRDRRLRLALHTGGPVLTVILALGLVWAWRESTAAQTHLREAKRNLSRYEAERDQRLDRERLAVPALVSQAREAIAARLFPEALASVDAALAFDPHHEEAQPMRARILVVLGRRDEAVQALDAYLTPNRVDPTAVRLRELCRPGREDVKTTQAIADLFLSHGASAEAEALFTGVDQREALWRDRLRKDFAGFDQRWLRRLEDGTYSLAVPRGKADGLTSLECLRDIPLSEVSILDALRLRDLTPLSGAPLVKVNFEGCGVRDLTPICAPTLRVLAVERTDVSDLTPTEGLSLTDVNIAFTAVASLKPLAKMPIENLNAYNCGAISDISFLRSARLGRLILGGKNADSAPKIVTLRPLEGRTISHIDLRNNRTLTDFSVLERIRPTQLLLDGTRIEDLSPLWSLQLTQLSVDNTAVTDVSPVAQQPLTQMTVPMAATQGWKTLQGNAGIQQINGLAAADFWVVRAVAEKLARSNPAFTWNLTGVVENGAVVELAFPNARLNDLSPLHGLALRRLTAWGNRISDGRPLRGMPLREVNVDGNPLTDIQWLDQSPIEDLRMSGTKVSDLTVLKKKNLRVLHTAGSAVRDVRPVLGLTIAEMTVTPKDLTADALKALRAAKDIQRLGIAWNQMWPASEFWQRVDRGEFK